MVEQKTVAEQKKSVKKTPLYDFHYEQGARFVDFAGYQLPIQYQGGIVEEHLYTRKQASLFDVSHMGQVHLKGSGVQKAFETLVGADLQGIKVGQMRYSQLTNEAGGIIDDLMITLLGPDHLFVVVNGARKQVDLAHFTKYLKGVEITSIQTHALIAVQGPKAALALSKIIEGVDALTFMHATFFSWEGQSLLVSRSGYTGEDGFEISVPITHAQILCEQLIKQDVRPAGLGARDTLRLEAGLCLYGQDLDETTSPVEARLTWSIAKNRRTPDAFLGANRIIEEIANGPKRRLVGLVPQGRMPIRHGVELFDEADKCVGVVTSGSFSPSLGHPIALGYVQEASKAQGTKLMARVRGRLCPVEVTKTPFISKNYAQ